jgi:hypothetical protein
MYKLFTDKTEVFECKIQLEGASIKNSQARLLIESENLSLVFKGEISSDGKCKIPIKKLKGLLDENTQGNVKLEVIAEDTYFTPWESKFTVETSRKITVEVKSQETLATVITESKPKVTIDEIPSTQSSKSIQESKHILKIIGLLKKENIYLNNISNNKVKLNNLIEAYLKKNNINPNQIGLIIEGVLKGLSKIS